MKKRKKKNNRQKQYIKRATILRDNNFKNYSEYLKSDEWKELKNKCLEKYGNVCSFCGINKGIQVHHTTYDRKNWSNQKVNNLYPVCERCHGEIFRIENQHNVSPQKATKIFRDTFFPGNKFRGQKKIKKERIFSLTPIERSQLPATLHHSLQSYKREYAGDIDEFLKYYEAKKIVKKDSEMLDLFYKHKDKIRKYIKDYAFGRKLLSH